MSTKKRETTSSLAIRAWGRNGMFSVANSNVTVSHGTAFVAVRSGRIGKHPPIEFVGNTDELRHFFEQILTQLKGQSAPDQRDTK